MLGDSSSVLAATTTASGSRGGGETSAAAPPFSSSSSPHLLVGSNNDQERGGDDGDRSFGGNRWPREETLALLRVRSEMDFAFRDASVKGPLWDEVSRKLAELGYNRSAKKCKEKFENVYKYHKRTKEGRTGKHEGKTYRFFDQLEAFESHPPPSYPPPPPPQKLQQPPPMPEANSPPPQPPVPPASHVITSAATAPSKNVLDQGIISTGINLTVTPQFTISTTNPIANPTMNVPSTVMPSFSGDLVSNSTSSSSTSSDVEIEGRRKRKWKDFLEGLMKEVINRQEEMQKRFLEAIEKREQERMAREESWRMQEMARINREREILAQERSMASAKDAAVMAFLQKLSEQQNPGNQQVQQYPPQPQNQPQPPPAPQPVVVSAPTPPPATLTPTATPAAGPQPMLTVSPTPVVRPQQVQTVPTPLPQQQHQQQQQTMSAMTSTPPARVQEARPDDNGDQLTLGASSSRWPKVEVEALIHLRTNLDSKYQENGPKGPLWEEISAAMRKLGYNRNAKRCKEKWENINKYFKKVKESNKKRPEDSKTCPYFHQLDALYREKNATTSNVQFKPENSVPLMVRPEQQWPPPAAPQLPLPSTQHNQPRDSTMDDLESDQDHDDKDNEDDDDEDEAGGYEIVPNRQTSISSAG